MTGGNNGQRQKHSWIVPVETEDGLQAEEVVKAYWDPEGETTNESVQLAACTRISRDGLGCKAIGPAELQA